jgi:hypothetical protein
MMTVRKADDLSEAKAIAARMLAMPPQPHEKKNAGKPKTKPAGGFTRSLQKTDKRRKTK